MTIRPNPSPRIMPLLRKTVVDSLGWDIGALDLSADNSRILGFLNAHAVNMAVRRPDFGDALVAFDWLLRDGIGIELALKYCDLPKTPNLNGTDLLPPILSRFTGRRIALFGASDEAIGKCAENLRAKNVCSVVATENGFHEDAFYLARAAELDADIIVLCMGMPRQEMLAVKLRDANAARLVICAGGWADFYSGVKVRAPEWMRAWRMEWLHRLMREPKRLGRRYTIDIIYYFYNIARARSGKI